MKAKFIFEKFEEHSDPIEDLGIGKIPEVILSRFIKELAKYDIKAKYRTSKYWGNGIWEFYFPDDLILQNLYVYYATDEAAEKEGMKGGFEIADEDKKPLLKNNTHKVDLPIKTIIKYKYGDKNKVSKKIKELEKRLAILKEIQKII